MSRVIESRDDSRVTREDLEWWLDLHHSLKWRTARTMPQYPHSYVVRGETLGDSDFIRAVKVIRVFGKPEKFNGRLGIYLANPRGPEKWWTMGDTLSGTRIINQDVTGKTYGIQNAPVTESGVESIYDGLAPIYDLRYRSAEDLEENEKVRKLFFQNFGLNLYLLDIGAGTGLALDLKLTVPHRYCAVDPSQGMLNELLRKYPKMRNIWPMTAEEYMRKHPDPSLGYFEGTVCLFGAASYLTPGVITRIIERVPGPSLFMAYEDGYLPDYYMGSSLKTCQGALSTLQSASEDLGGVSCTRGKIGHFETFVFRKD